MELLVLKPQDSSTFYLLDLVLRFVQILSIEPYVDMHACSYGVLVKPQRNLAVGCFSGGTSDESGQHADIAEVNHSPSVTNS